MNLAVVPSVGQLKSNKQEGILAVDTVALSAKCSPQFVPHAENKRRFLSNPRVTSRFIAVIVTNHAHAIIIEFQIIIAWRQTVEGLQKPIPEGIGFFAFQKVYLSGGITQLELSLRTRN